jgi:hypothetical protein
MTVTDRITPTVPNIDFDRERSGMAAFFTGRGDTSTPHGLITAHTPNLPPDPATIAALPIGRQLLTATTAEDFHTALAAFADVWRAAGFGDATTDHTDPPPALGTCPPPDGDCLRRFTHPAYAFDGDQVLYCQRGWPRWVPNRATWYALTVTTTDEGTAVDLVPATRRHGESYLDTEALDLPQLAVWLMADLTRLARDTTSVIPPQSRFAVAVNTARAEIRLYHYGLTRADDGRAVWEAVSAATAFHNWTNPHDNADRRFTVLPDTPRDDQIPELRERGRGPGTVTVLAEPHTFWT